LEKKPIVKMCVGQVESEKGMFPKKIFCSFKQDLIHER